MKEEKMPFLIPAIIQDHKTKEVLMLGYMSKQSLEKSIQTKRTWFYSRSKKRLWNKGETSGNFQNIKEIKYDCDNDTLLISVEQIGNACHTGNKSCFYRSLEDGDIEKTGLDFKSHSGAGILDEVYGVIQQRLEEKADDSYTYSLHKKGIEEILKKLGEEVIEVIISAKYEEKGKSVYEVADLLYHLMVMMVEKNISLDDIYDELRSRRKQV